MQELTSPKPNDALATTRISRSMQVRGNERIAPFEFGMQVLAIQRRMREVALQLQNTGDAFDRAQPRRAHGRIIDFGAVRSGKRSAGRPSAHRQLRTSMRSPCVAVRWPEMRSMSPGAIPADSHRRMNAAPHAFRRCPRSSCRHCAARRNSRRHRRPRHKSAPRAAARSPGFRAAPRPRRPPGRIRRP